MVVIATSVQGVLPFPMVTVCPQTADGVTFLKKYFNDRKRKRTEIEIAEEKSMFYGMKAVVIHNLLMQQRYKHRFYR